MMTSLCQIDKSYVLKCLTGSFPLVYYFSVHEPAIQCGCKDIRGQKLSILRIEEISPEKDRRTLDEGVYRVIGPDARSVLLNR